MWFTLRLEAFKRFVPLIYITPTNFSLSHTHNLTIFEVFKLVSLHNIILNIFMQLALVYIA